MLIIGCLAALFIIGALLLAILLLVPLWFGGNEVDVVPTATSTRIQIPSTATRTPQASPTLVVVGGSSVATPVLGVGERRVLVELGAANAVALTTFELDKTPLVQKGTFTYEPGTKRLALILTEINGQPFKDEILFEVNGTTLIALSYNKALHPDLSNVQLNKGPSSLRQPLPQGRPAGFARPAAQPTATPYPLTGGYGGTIPGVSANARVTALYLGTDGAAVLSILEGGKPSVVEIGSWTATGNNVTVKIALRDGVKLKKPETLVLTYDDDVLTGTQYDKARYGDSLSLTRDPASRVSPDSPIPGTYIQVANLEATPTAIAITATPIFITATPVKGAAPPATNGGSGGQLPSSGMGEDLLLLFGGGLLLLGVIIVVRRMRSK